MIFIQAVLIALSLCADCFAVSVCSSVTLSVISRKSVFRTALVFAVIQSGLLAAGWAFGNIFVGLVEKVSHIIGFLLLLYVGGGMIASGIKALRGKCDEETSDLNGLRNVIVAGIATSIDALAVGVSQSMDGQDWAGFRPLLVSLFVITFLSVVAGIAGGRKVGEKFGHRAEIAGGLVLIGIGLRILLS